MTTVRRLSPSPAAQMQVGMSRAQVRQLLGTPLLTDMFHADRWDYLFYFKRGSTSIVQQRGYSGGAASHTSRFSGGSKPDTHRPRDGAQRSSA